MPLRQKSNELLRTGGAICWIGIRKVTWMMQNARRRCFKRDKGEAKQREGVIWLLLCVVENWCLWWTKLKKNLRVKKIGKRLDGGWSHYASAILLLFWLFWINLSRYDWGSVNSWRVCRCWWRKARTRGGSADFISSDYYAPPKHPTKPSQAKTDPTRQSIQC